MQKLFPRISICVILIVVNEISDSVCKTVSVGVLQAVRAKENELMQNFKDLPRLIATDNYWQRLKANFSLSFNFRHCPCSVKSVIINMLDLWFDTWWNRSMGLDFVLTGDCVPGCQLSSFYGFSRTPTLVKGCMSEIFSDRQVFPFMIRLIGAWRKMAQPFYEFMKYFGWSKVAIVSSYRDTIYTGALEMRRFFRDQGMTVYYDTVDYYNSFTLPNNLTRMQEVAESAGRESGILLLMLTQQDRMLFLQVAKDLHMLNGKYAFLTVYNFDNSSTEAIKLQEGLIQIRVVDTEEAMFDPRILDAIELYLRARKKSDDTEQIMALMRNDSFVGSSGHVIFDGDGLRLDHYHMVNIRNGTPVDVMHMSYETPDQRLDVKYLNMTAIVWPGGELKAPNDTIGATRKPDVPGLQVMVILIVIGYISGVLLLYFAYRELRYRMLLKASEKWIIDWRDLKFEDPNKMYDDAKSLTSDGISDIDEMRSSRSRPSEMSYIDAEYENGAVLVQTLLCGSINLKHRKILKEIHMTMSLSHENVVRYLGICPSAPNVAIVMSVGKRGSLQDVIMSSYRGVLTLDFVVSLLIDAAKGIEYLHSTELGSHGHLTSAKCVLDSRWTCMISGCGFRRLKRCRNKAIIESLQDDFYFRGLLWTAPEILRQSPERRPIYGTKEGDVYSFAIICQEAVYSDSPFVKESTLMQFRDIVKEVKKKSSTPFRPSLADADCSREFLDLIKSCWHEVPNKRPSFHKIILELEKLFESSGDAHTGLMEKLMMRTEKHVLNLADQVEEATAEIITEKKKADDLLQALLPGYVAKILESGRMFVPQEYDSISMLFADIVEFTKIAAMSTPMQVVQLLSLLYSKYDDITDAHNAYKIETIGDCYVVASGVPERNGKRHAMHIADLAIDFLHTIENFTIPYLDGAPLLTRIGVHSGPAVAGVVGVKVPRLNVFGLTVITASKLESTGAVNKIHISSSTASILRATNRYILQYRGEREITKGNSMRTYFLIGHKQRKSQDVRTRRQDSLVKPQVEEVQPESPPEESPVKLQEYTDSTATKAEHIWQGVYSRIVGDRGHTTPLVRRSRHSGSTAPIVRRSTDTDSTAPIVRRSTDTDSTAPIVRRSTDTDSTAPLVRRSTDTDSTAPIFGRSTDTDSTAPLVRRSRDSGSTAPQDRRPSSKRDNSNSAPRRPTVAFTSDSVHPRISPYKQPSPRQNSGTSDSAHPRISRYKQPSHRQNSGRLSQTLTDRGVTVTNLLKTASNKTNKNRHETSNAE